MDIDLTGLVLPERIEITEVSDDGRSAAFVLEPLERGFGHTLGNSVRRVLLSSLQGAAVRAFRIDGVLHEHQTIPSVVEDVHQIIQNLKSLVVSLDDGVDEAVLSISASSAGPVTAEGIRGPGSVTIHDPGHHILTLQEDRELNLELHVDRGRGFVLADQQPPSKAEGGPVDLVRIDAIYNPVLRANFTVEETRVGQRTDFDKLTIHVETDGSVGPESAIRYASELLRRHLKYMRYFSEGALPDLASGHLVPVPERWAVLFRTPIDDLTELKVRSRKTLSKESINTLGELVAHTEEEMLKIENFGEKSLEEARSFLANYKLRFGIRTETGPDGTLYFSRRKTVVEVDS